MYTLYIHIIFIYNLRANKIGFYNEIQLLIYECIFACRSIIGVTMFSIKGGGGKIIYII